MSASWILTPELEPPELEGDQAVTHLDHVYEGVEVVRGHDEAVSLLYVTPAPQHQVPTQTVLKGTSQVLVEYRVQVVVVGTWRKETEDINIQYQQGDINFYYKGVLRGVLLRQTRAFYSLLGTECKDIKEDRVSTGIPQWFTWVTVQLRR